MSRDIFGHIGQLPLYYLFSSLAIFCTTLRLMVIGLSKLRSLRAQLIEMMKSAPNSNLFRLQKTQEVHIDSSMSDGDTQRLNAMDDTVVRHTRSGRIYGSYDLSWHEFIAQRETL